MEASSLITSCWSLCEALEADSRGVARPLIDVVCSSVLEIGLSNSMNTLYKWKLPKDLSQCDRRVMKVRVYGDFYGIVVMEVEDRWGSSGGLLWWSVQGVGEVLCMCRVKLNGIWVVKVRFWEVFQLRIKKGEKEVRGRWWPASENVKWVEWGFTGERKAMARAPRCNAVAWAMWLATTSCKPKLGTVASHCHPSHLAITP